MELQVARRKASRIVSAVRGEGEPPVVEEGETVPKILKLRAERKGSAVAMRWKRLGVWHEYSWAEVYSIVRKFALGLKALGVGRGTVVATIGDNKPHQVWTWLAAQSLGGIAARSMPTRCPMRSRHRCRYSRRP